MLRRFELRGHGRFWTPGDLADSEAFYRELHDEPAGYRTLDGVHERARGALADSAR